MNSRFFELVRPLHFWSVPSESDNGNTASGKVFLHVYPSGYLTIHFAISINRAAGMAISSLTQALEAIEPWRDQSKWLWHSRIADGNSSFLTSVFKDRINASILRSGKVRYGPWFTSLKLATTAGENTIAAVFFPVTKSQTLKTIPKLGGGGFRFLIVSKSKLVCVFAKGRRIQSEDSFHPKRAGRASLRFFWRVIALSEFVLLKIQVYDGYRNYLEKEVLSLRDERLTIKEKVRAKRLIKLSRYDSSIPAYLAALDRHIRSAPPFLRLVYSTIAVATRFDSQRLNLQKVVKAWLEEVGQWSHPMRALLKELASFFTKRAKGGS
ncbi:MAG TPA: hypothetical protein DC047_12090 [Blastocatellia bacterium]|nr:hypothetical protein [Blastocatellia bacterium]